MYPRASWPTVDKYRIIINNEYGCCVSDNGLIIERNSLNTVYLISNTVFCGNWFIGIVVEEKIDGIKTTGKPRELFVGEILRPMDGTSYRQIEKTTNDRRNRLQRQADDDLLMTECKTYLKHLF